MTSRPASRPTARPARVLIRWLRPGHGMNFEQFADKLASDPTGFYRPVTTDVPLPPSDPRSDASGWSLVVRDMRDTDVPLRLSVGSLAFLFRHAPHEVLERIGHRLTFLDGSDPTAHVVVVPPWVESVADADEGMLAAVGAVGATSPEPATA